MPLLDFNEMMGLSPDDFFDHHHLSRSGAEAFNTRLLATLIDLELLPRP